MGPAARGSPAGGCADGDASGDGGNDALGAAPGEPGGTAKGWAGVDGAGADGGERSGAAAAGWLGLSFSAGGQPEGWLAHPLKVPKITQLNRVWSGLMLLMVLEALGALALLVFIVWWTMFSGRRRGERNDEDKPS
ncbi:MAG: hypothetical protein V4739_13145 [Pseudomonadota bacterium]